jgi:hypothetical protein
LQVKKIAFFEMDKSRIAYFKQHLSDYELRFYTENLSEKKPKLLLPEPPDLIILM